MSLEFFNMTFGRACKNWKTRTNFALGTIEAMAKAFGWTPEETEEALRKHCTPSATDLDKLNVRALKEDMETAKCMANRTTEKVTDDDHSTDKPGSKTMNESSELMPEFRRFPKICHLYRDIIITEKIDGTNAQVFVTEDGEIFAGSRKRWLTPEADNYGFAAWVEEHKCGLQRLGPGRHFGEWWGQGINRGYGLDHKRFSLFNVSRWTSGPTQLGCTRLGIPDTAIYAPYPCLTVPILYRGPFVTNRINDVRNTLQAMGSIAAPDFKKPEGIVIFHQQSGHLFKVTIENDEKPKSFFETVGELDEIPDDTNKQEGK